MGKKILTNEQTKMSELTKYKLNAFGDTEDDIMHNIGFYKVPARKPTCPWAMG